MCDWYKENELPFFTELYFCTLVICIIYCIILDWGSSPNSVTSHSDARCIGMLHTLLHQWSANWSRECELQGNTEFAEIRQIWNSTKFGSQITPNCLNAHGIDRMWGTVQVWCKLEIRRFELWVSCAEPFLLGSLVAAHKKLCTPCSRLCNNDCNTVVFQLQVLYKKQ